MDHYVVIEYERMAKGVRLTSEGTSDIFKVMPCFNILYTVPIEYCMQKPDIGEDPTCFAACRVWLENNRVEGSKYAITKMWLV